MPETRVPDHGFESTVKLIAPAMDHSRHPADKVVFEDAFMELVEDVGCERVEDVAMR